MPQNELIGSVRNYPYQPRAESVRHRLLVIFANAVIADTRSGLRILETSHPLIHYFPPSDLSRNLLRSWGGDTTCEFKGVPEYMSIGVQDRMARRTAWLYPYPDCPHEAIAGFFAFYSSRFVRCSIGHEQVTAREGDFYGGRITGSLRSSQGSFSSGGW